MALISCPQCGGQISDRVSECPHCNFDMEEYNRKLKEEALEIERQKKAEEARKEEEQAKKLRELELKERCPECEQLVDKGVEKCPFCGFPVREEKERILEIELNKKKKYRKLGIIITSTIAAILIIVLGVSGYNKNMKYKKAVNLMELGELDDAERLFKELKNYKDTKDMLACINIGYDMEEIISVEDDFMYTDIFDPNEIDNVLDDSAKYKSLDNLRSELVKHLYKIAAEYIEMGYDGYYDFAQYLIDSISKYTDTKDLVIKKQNGEIMEIVQEKMEAKEYDEIIKELDKVEQKNNVVQLFSDTYKKLYETYGSFLGDWGSSTKNDGFEFSILYDFYGKENKSKECYFEVRHDGFELQNAETSKEKSGWDYKKMQVKGDTMSFMYNISGNFEPEYKKVICKNTGEGVEIKVDGKMIDTNPSIEGEEEKKEEPKIGDSEYDVRLSSWGAPKKINRTKTGSMISEQWVYDNNRYIYLDNGKVTAIQD